MVGKRYTIQKENYRIHGFKNLFTVFDAKILKAVTTG
jgi:hypothetical protein